MSLPKLETAKYTTTIPSTKEEIEYRPFLVKEEKVLMVAQESSDTAQITKAMIDILDACTFNKIDCNKLTTYDLEYLFLQLRTKSVGEIAKLRFKCQKSGEYVNVDLDLREVQVHYPEENPETNVKLSDEVGITLKPIYLSELRNIDTENEQEAFMQGVAAAIDTVYDNEGVYQLSDFNKKEQHEFIDSLNHGQLEKIQHWINVQPTLRHEVEYVGPTGHQNKHLIEGLTAFFT